MTRDRERYERRLGAVVDGRWRIDALLGWGSTSAVYQATHRNGNRAALKILHPSLCSEPAMTERFLREAGIANAIRHPAIVPIRDDGKTEEGCAYLVLELLVGDTTEARREQSGGRLPLEVLAPIAAELMGAIGAVHDAGVVHRDLKPQNVFLTQGGELKLLDFGTARIFDRTPGSPLSLQGLARGMPAFMSPEQARGARDEVDAQSDVWSLGATLFTLLSGAHVHAARDAHKQLLAAATNPARSLAEVAPSLDARVVAVIDRALAFAKADRWADAHTMQRAFRAAVLAALPSSSRLRAFAGESNPEAPGTKEVSEPTLVTSAISVDVEIAEAPGGGRAPGEPSVAPLPAPPPAHSDSAMLVTATHGQRRVSAAAPVSLPALLAGLGAMAATIVLVVFFVAGGDEASPPAPAAAALPSMEAPKVEAPAAPPVLVVAPAEQEPVSASSDAAAAPEVPSPSRKPERARERSSVALAPPTPEAPVRTPSPAEGREPIDLAAPVPEAASTPEAAARVEAAPRVEAALEPTAPATE